MHLLGYLRVNLQRDMISPVLHKAKGDAMTSSKVAGPNVGSTNKREWVGMLLRSLSVVAALFLAVTYSTRADDIVTFSNVTVYYVGPSSDANSDNPFGITHMGGNSISSFNGGMTSAGSVETVTFDAGPNENAGNAPAISITGGAVTMSLYGPDTNAGAPYSAGPLVSASNTLVSGLYEFDQCPPTNSPFGDYFGINDPGHTNTAQGCNPQSYNNWGVVNCLGNDLCLVGASPAGISSIDVTPNLITITSGSFEVAFNPTPELPSAILFGTGLMAIGLLTSMSKKWLRV